MIKDELLVNRNEAWMQYAATRPASSYEQDDFEAGWDAAADEITRQQAVIAELVEGLEEIAEMDTDICGYTARALIAKHKRS